MNELFRAAFIIARRDFVATVFSRAFLLFLLGPLFPLVIAVIFGGIGGSIGDDVQRPLVAVVSTEAEFAELSSVRDRLAGGIGEGGLVRLRRVAPEADAEALRRRLLDSDDSPILAVLEGGLSQPRMTGDVRPDGNAARQIGLLIDDARRLDGAPSPAGAPLIVEPVESSGGSLATARGLTARGAQSVLFILTILLAGMTLSQLIEEKSNKIIEVLASAVPIDSIFLGKLLAMLATSLLGIAVWTSAGAGAIALLSEQGLGNLPAPAIGWPLFLALALIYFAMSYLLLGALFLGIGAHASTAREVQTLSMPVTMAQVLVFAVAAIAVGDYDGGMAIGAVIFPLSSPYVMIARAAELPQIWPHLAALAWQLLWVALILRVASRLFSRSVLNSGPVRRRWWRRGAARA